MEQEAAFLSWLHEECGYSFNGDANISGLTQLELNALRLGHAVRDEQQEEQQESAKRGRRHSKPRRTTREAMREFEEKELKAQ